MSSPTPNCRKATRDSASPKPKSTEKNVDHLRVCSPDIHCLNLSTCSRMVIFYKRLFFFILLKNEVSHLLCNLHEIMREQGVGNAFVSQMNCEL